MHVLTHQFYKYVIIHTQEIMTARCLLNKHLLWISFEPTRIHIQYLRESHQTLCGAVNVVWCRYGGWGGTVAWDEFKRRCSDSQPSWMFLDHYLLPYMICIATINILTTACLEGRRVCGGLRPAACHSNGPNPRPALYALATSQPAL